MNPMINKSPLITFSDIGIDAQYTESITRSCLDVSTEIAGQKLELPVISANMPQITEAKMVKEMYANGGRGILHRFMSIDQNLKEFNKASSLMDDMPHDCEQHKKNIWVSVGVKEEEKERFEKLYELGAKVFCIDIAHGHSIMMKNMIEWMLNQADEINIIAGNVCTRQAALDLASWGVKTIKVGIGPGSVCRTRSNTGVGKPQFSALLEVKEALDDLGHTDIRIISDGGIKTTGDIAKALIVADAVMVGAVLSGTTETPGKVFAVAGTDLTNRQWYKVYGGSASAENKSLNSTNKEVKFVEGEMKTVPFKGHAKYLLREIRDGLQSTLSYNGSSNLKEYRENVEWFIMSNGGKIESKV
jgi:IMP dehydrogenase